MPRAIEGMLSPASDESQAFDGLAGEIGNQLMNLVGGIMTYSDAQVSATAAAMDRYSGDKGEVGAALAVVGLRADRAAKEAQIRDDMIRVARRSGASLRQLAEVSGLDRKTATAIVAEDVRAPD